MRASSQRIAHSECRDRESVSFALNAGSIIKSIHSVRDCTTDKRFRYIFFMYFFSNLGHIGLLISKNNNNSHGGK